MLLELLTSVLVVLLIALLCDYALSDTDESYVSHIIWDRTIFVVLSDSLDDGRKHELSLNRQMQELLEYQHMIAQAKEELKAKIEESLCPGNIVSTRYKYIHVIQVCKSVVLTFIFQVVKIIKTIMKGDGVYASR